MSLQVGICALGDGGYAFYLHRSRSYTENSTADEHHETAYKQYIKSLKALPTFASSFTALGIYYLSVIPPDPGRASRCFQKAFELDAREGEAARRLAKGFADEREWDLVEVVAHRTIEGEGGAEVDATEVAASRYAPTNAWAWKAMGVVHLVGLVYLSLMHIDD